MTRLFLLRHSKAGWAEPGMRDFDRPLDATGKADAEAIGKAMHACGYNPDLILCSSARRARETLDGLFRHFSADHGRVSFMDSLYTEDAYGYLTIIHEYGRTTPSMLVIGHNPMMEDLAMAISGDGDDQARGAMIGGFPTSALAVIHFNNGIGEAEPGKGYLEAFFTPADL
ncbi:MAG: histidine phosphatase family protein [Mesorhizobium sp.]